MSGAKYTANGDTAMTRGADTDRACVPDFCVEPVHVIVHDHGCGRDHGDRARSREFERDFDVAPDRDELGRVLVRAHVRATDPNCVHVVGFRGCAVDVLSVYD